MSVLIKANDKFWINPAAILYVERLSAGVTICLNGSEVWISKEDWAAIEPLVTLPARAAGSIPAPKTVTVNGPESVADDLMRQTIDEAVAEDVKAHEDRLLAELRVKQEKWHADLLREEQTRPAPSDDEDDDWIDDDEPPYEDDGDSEADEPKSSDLSRLIQVVQSGDFVILDTETTGLYEDAEICQIAIIDPSGKTLMDTLVRPQKPIPAKATSIHGISNETVINAPRWIDIRNDVWETLFGKTVIVYNAEYDFKMLVQTEKASDANSQWEWTMLGRECAMLAYGEYRGIWNDYFGNWKWHKLVDAAARVGYSLPAGMKAHSALADCLMTLAVCRKLAGV